VSKVSDREALLALARVVNTGGDETARQTLADYQAQSDTSSSGTANSDDESGDTGSAGRRARS
jgi:hypothetical protein